MLPHPTTSIHQHPPEQRASPRTQNLEGMNWRRAVLPSHPLPSHRSNTQPHATVNHNTIFFINGQASAASMSPPAFSDPSLNFRLSPPASAPERSCLAGPGVRMISGSAPAALSLSTAGSADH